MIGYLDSSILLSYVLGQKVKAFKWSSFDSWYSSILLEVECYRVLDRLRLQGDLTDVQLAKTRSAVSKHLRPIGLIGIGPEIAKRAAGAFPTVLKTLDAIHLSTALLIAERLERSICLVSSDNQLITAARACGLAVQPN